jgi:hypothetical protein
VFLSRPWLLGELLRNFSSAWLTALPPLVRTCAEDVARGALSVGLLQATRERFQAMLRGHTALFVRGLARNFGMWVVWGCACLCVSVCIVCVGLCVSVSVECVCVCVSATLGAFNRGLTHRLHAGFEAVCRLPKSEGPLSSDALLASLTDTDIADPGSKVLVLALRTQRLPSIEDMFVSLRQPMLRYDSNIPFAPRTPGYR